MAGATLAEPASEAVADRPATRIRLSGWRQPAIFLRALLAVLLIRTAFALLPLLKITSLQVGFAISLGLLLSVYYPMFILLREWTVRLSPRGAIVPGLFWTRRWAWEEIGNVRVLKTGPFEWLGYDIDAPGARPSLDGWLLRRFCGVDGVLGLRSEARDREAADLFIQTRLRRVEGPAAVEAAFPALASAEPPPSERAEGGSLSGARLRALLTGPMAARPYWLALLVIAAAGLGAGMLTAMAGVGLALALLAWTPAAIARLRGLNQSPFWIGLVFLVILAASLLGRLLGWPLQAALLLGGYAWLALGVALGFARASAGPDGGGGAGSAAKAEPAPDTAS